MPRQQPRRPAIHYWGFAILVIGFLSAALIYAFAGDDADAAREIASQRMYQHNIALMGGQFAVLSDEFNQWFGSLWHGRTLAYTVAVLAVAIAAACFWIEGLISVPAAGDKDRKVDS